MPIRVQSAEIEIPDDPNGNPFEHDLLERKDSIEALTTLLGNVKGPCVMAVDASWGMGKTTFLRMWSQYLRNQDFPVVDFNAWETDYAGQPFVVLTSEITDGLRRRLDDLDSPRFKRLVESSGRVLNRLSAPAVRLAASAVPLMGNQLVQELDSDPATLAETMATDYSSMKGAMTEFRLHLEKAAAEVAALAGGHPLVVFIDELDRCRPTYAIELLETAKHFFNVDHVVFVLCLDRKQLAHSVKAVYGNDFAADGYLRRFFDIDYRLPHPDRKGFVASGLAATGIPDFLKNPSRIQENPATTLRLINEILSSRPFSLRDTLQTIHRLGVVLSSTPIDTPGIHVHTLTVLLLLRFIGPTTYEHLLQGTAKDSDAIDALFSHPETHAFRDSEDGRIAISILISSVILSRMDDGMLVTIRDYDAYASYHDLADTELVAGTPSRDRENILRARQIVGDVSRYTNRNSGWPEDPPTVIDGCGYRQAVRHLELFPAEVSQ